LGLIVASGACSSYSSSDTTPAEAGAPPPPPPLSPPPPPVDGGDASDAAKPFTCADHTSALFCTDFDTQSVDDGWSQKIVAGGGTASLDSTRFVSAPTSFHAATPANAAGSTIALLGKSLPPSVKSWKQLHVELDMRLDGLPDNSVMLLSLCATDGNGSHCGELGGVEIRVDQAGLYVFEYLNDDGGPGTQFRHELSVPTTSKIGAFSHVVLDVTFTTIALSIDGTAKLPPSEISHASSYAANPYLSLGVSTAQIPSFDAWYDNLLVEGD
jgi:hypothetical protein